MPPLQEDDLSEVFFDAWRQLRRGDVTKRMIPIFSDIASLDLSSAENDILQVLISYPRGCEMGVVADLVGLDRANFTRTVDTLNKKGLVKRLNQKKDSRKRTVILTKTGIEISKAHIQLRAKVFAMFTADLSAGEKRKFVHHLLQILERIKTLNPFEIKLPEAN